MACKYCEFKGYILTSFFANNTENTTVAPCPKCKDTEAYSKYVKSQYSLTACNECEIIDLAEYRKKKTLK